MLNLGILAHVDAGKTTLTERLLYAAGVLESVGSVDSGTTLTDSLSLERARGITIKTAVASFAVDDVTVNVIDTPGHPDFIAEVERALGVLDGAVLVISAVEGVQPQTRILLRALERLRVPTLLFVNKIDRSGADVGRVLEAISRRLTPDIVAMGEVEQAGTPTAGFAPRPRSDPDFRAALIEVLAARSDALLADYVEAESSVTGRRLWKELAAQTERALVHPVYCGSAITGAGIEPLMSGLVELLPAATPDADGPVSGRVFKVERGSAGEKIAYVRMFAGTVRIRERLHLGHDRQAKATAIDVFDEGAWVRQRHVASGQIGKLWGLAEVQVGDTIGAQSPIGEHHRFPPPTHETVVRPVRRAQGAVLRDALIQLAEQDPLINVRQDDIGGELSVTLYGEVQKQVIQATLADEYGIEVGFRESTTICVERPNGTGEAVEILFAESNPFLATIGLRVDPAPPGSGIEFRLRVGYQRVPLYVYKNIDAFADAMGQYVRQTLQEGLYGWQVTDCVVTMVECTYSSPDGPPSTNGPPSTAADFRKLTPLVLMNALHQAGTVVCEPMLRISLEIPAETIGPVLAAVARLGAAIERQTQQAELATIHTMLPAARMHELQRQLPALTGGEGVLDSQFGGYQPVTSSPPTRQRTTVNPLNRKEYLLHATRLGAGVRRQREQDE